MVIKMHRELITIGPITIYWYSVIIITAIVIGIYFSSKKAEKNGLGKDFLLDLIFYLIPVGVLGARIYYVIFNYSVFKGDYLSIFKIWEGGLAIYGAVISSIIFIIYYCKKKNKDIFPTLSAKCGAWNINITIRSLQNLKYAAPAAEEKCARYFLTRGKTAQSSMRGTSTLSFPHGKTHLRKTESIWKKWRRGKSR